MSRFTNHGYSPLGVMRATPPRRYQDSAAYQRSQRLREDGTPVWPLRPEDNRSNFGIAYP